MTLSVNEPKGEGEGEKKGKRERDITNVFLSRNVFTKSQFGIHKVKKMGN